LTPALFTNVTYVLGNATQLLTPKFVNETRDLIDGVSPVITPDLLAEVGGLLNNANDLLTRKFVNETQVLIEDASEVCSLTLKITRQYR
jgi:hypothetical protein